MSHQRGKPRLSRAETSGTADGSAAGVAPDPAWLRAIEHRPITFIILAVMALLLPFVAKPVHIDDPMYIWAAEHILTNPWDFYGSRVSWTGLEMPMHQLMQNPPLTSYFIAAIGVISGIREVPLHLAFVIPAVFLAIGTWQLARDLCRWPALAALLAVMTPVFAVSATTLMSDIIMTCCWVWAIHWWMDGLRRNAWKPMVLTGVMISLACLAKYPAVNLFPLLIAYAVVQRALWKYFTVLLIPAAVLLGYELVTKSLYGVGLFSEAFVYAREVRSIRQADATHRMFIALCFTGACLAPLLIVGPFLWARRGLIAGGSAFLLIGLTLAMLQPQKMPHLMQNEFYNWPMIGQVALWATVGLSAVALCLLDLHRHRNADSVLLLLWVLGTLAFAGFMNWSVNARTLLPMAPAVAILIVRRLETRGVMTRPEVARAFPVAFGLALALCFAVMWADQSMARASKRAVNRISAAYGGGPSTLWFQGSWGFQYEMQRRGAQPLEFGISPLKVNDVIATPLYSSNVRDLEEPLFTTVKAFEEPVCGWLSTMNPVVGAGFYSHAAGPLPFVFGVIPAERYLIQRVNVNLDPSQNR